jgi:hypothetical protein
VVISDVSGLGVFLAQKSFPVVMDHKRRRKSALGCFTCKYVCTTEYNIFLKVSTALIGQPWKKTILKLRANEQ